MKKIRKRSPVPLYGTAAVWVLWCLFLPLYKPSHFLLLIAAAAASYLVLSKFFPGETVEVKEPEKPVTTGNEEVDALLAEGAKAVSEMKRLQGSIGDEAVRGKIGELIDVTGKIFSDVKDDPKDAPQVKRFASYYLPTTLKLLNAYDRMSAQNIGGDNISGTLERIESILDTTIAAYKKQLDALFADQALDVDTDITVLETMLKREGLTGSDFKQNTKGSN